MNKTLNAVLIAVVATGILSADALADNMAKGSIPVSLKNSLLKKREYTELAKVSLTQAVEKALKEVPGKAVDAELEEEDGFLVYSIKVIGADKYVTELKIDAGNLAILERESKQKFWD